MVFRRFRQSANRLRPVNRIKHVIDQQAGVVLGSPATFDIIESNDAPVIANTNECETGSTVHGIYLKVEGYATTDGALANFYMMVMKNPGANFTFPNANVIGSSDLKKYVIHQEMIMFERSINGNPRTLFNGVIVIPRGYKRNGPNDKLQIQLFSPGINADICFQSHYKEFR